MRPATLNFRGPPEGQTCLSAPLEIPLLIQRSGTAFLEALQDTPLNKKAPRTNRGAKQ
jgi:hypothetical protein